MIVGQSCASYVTHAEKWNSAITDEYSTIRRSLDMNVSLISDSYHNARGVKNEIMVLQNMQNIFADHGSSKQLPKM